MKINKINNIPMIKSTLNNKKSTFCIQESACDVYFGRRYKGKHSSRSNNQNGLLKPFFAILLALGISVGGCFTLAETTEKKDDDILLIENFDAAENVLIEEEVQETTAEKAEKVLQENPEVKEQYDNLTSAIDTFSEQLGEDGLALIKKRVDKLGDGKVEVLDVLKVLWIESRGNIYDENTGDILKSSSNAYGAFQVRKPTADDLSRYFKLDKIGEPLDVEDPYDNIDACIYNLRFLHDKRSDDLADGDILPTGDNLKHAIMWSYHDGAWAEKFSYYGEQYVYSYEMLSKVDKYPEVVEYILNEDVLS